VLARDYSEIKKKFFKNTESVPDGNPETNYSVFHDVDASGNILARDYAEVKKRFFQTLSIPAPVAAATAGESASAGPEGSSITKDLFGSAPILA
jgi:hypothetical protein